MKAAAAQLRSLDDDPRVVAWVAARKHGGQRLVDALVPYAEAHAEEVDRLYGGTPERERMRLLVMQRLTESPAEVPLVAVALGFKATKAELDHVATAPRFQAGEIKL